MEIYKERKVITTCVLGTMLEWYDFSIFGIMATIIAIKFFPMLSHTTSLILTFLIFFTGYFFRPFCGLILGHLGDTFGRKNTLLLTLFLMAFSTAMIGLLPTYEVIGIISPIMLVILRVLQGFSASGEHAGIITFLSESSKAHRRGFLTSLPLAGVFGGICIATLASLFIYSLTPSEIFKAWGWRVPFLLSGLLAIVGYYLRVNMLESDAFERYKASGLKQPLPIVSVFKEHFRLVLIGTGLFQLAMIFPYAIYIYAPAYLINANVFSFYSAMIIVFVNTIIMALLVPFFGWLSDNKCPIKLMIISVSIDIVLLLPGYTFLLSQTLSGYFIGMLLLTIISAVYIGCISGQVAALFPIEARFTGVALSINLAAALFGGTIPLLFSLTQYLKNPFIYQIIYLVVLCVLSLYLLLRYENELRNVNHFEKIL